MFASALLLLIVFESLPFASAASDDETARWWQDVEALGETRCRDDWRAGGLPPSGR